MLRIFVYVFVRRNGHFLPPSLVVKYLSHALDELT